MAWYPGAKKLELQPESDQQHAIRPTQFIVHSIAAPWDEQRIYEYWRDSTNLESHFGLDYDGSIGQFIGTETRADANYRANERPDGTGANSLESASNLQHSDPWTPEQIEQLIRVGVWEHETHGIPLRICRTHDDPGFGYHRLFPEWSTSGTACPGDARVRQFKEVVFPGIVARATGQTTTPDTTPEEDPMPLMLNESQPADTELTVSAWTDLPFDDAVLHKGPRAHVTVVHLQMGSGTPADAAVLGRFYLADENGGNPSSFLPIRKVGGGGHQFVCSSEIPAGRFLRFQALAVTQHGESLTVIHRTASGPYWAA